MVWDTADAGFTAIKNAYFNNTLIGMAAMDGPIATNGNQGLWGVLSPLSTSPAVRTLGGCDQCEGDC